MTHSSYPNEHPNPPQESNERLEFLGDALLGLVIAQDLYERYPSMNEGQLTQLRSVIVRGESLARVAHRLRIGQYLRLGKGAAASGGAEQDSNLAGALEALAGAIFLDSGFRAASVWAKRILRSELKDITGTGVAYEAKTRLQELTQRQGSQLPQYRVVHVAGPEHQQSFIVEVSVDGNVIGRGEGRRKAEAEERAAEEALEVIP